MVVLLRLLDQLVVNQVSRKGHSGDAEAGESRLESVEARELALVSPRVSFGPGIAAHGGDFSSTDYSQMLLLVGGSCAHRSIMAISCLGRRFVLGILGFEEFCSCCVSFVAWFVCLYVLTLVLGRGAVYSVDEESWGRIEEMNCSQEIVSVFCVLWFLCRFNFCGHLHTLEQPL